MKESFKVGEIVKLVNPGGYIIDPEISALKGCKLKDIWGIVVDVAGRDEPDPLAIVWLFSKKDGQLLSLNEKLRPWSFSFSALKRVGQRERKKYNFS